MTTLSDRSAMKKERLVRSIQEREFPEGAPPPPAAQRRWALVGVASLTALGGATVGALFLIDGPAAVVAGAAMLLTYVVLGGATAVLGVMERARVRKKIEERVAP